jgi:hypothetical protein
MGGTMGRRIAALAASLAVVMGIGLLSAPPVDAKERTVQSLLRSLKVAPERPGGYDRRLFPHWDTVRPGCTVRSIVLIQEARRGPSTGQSCPVGPGEWFSQFDGITVTDPARLDIDHMVPLAEAWRSGARTWSPVVRRAFANDLGYAGSLIAVTASSNRSKGDQDPARWLPTRVSYRCTYVSEWIAVKWRWRLRVDATEQAALRVQVSACKNPRITVPARAR